MKYEIISLDKFIQKKALEKLKTDHLERAYPERNTINVKKLKKCQELFKKNINKHFAAIKSIKTRVVRFIDDAVIIKFNVRFKNKKKSSFFLKHIKRKENLFAEIFYNNQLGAKGIGVPKIYYYNLKSGIIIYEDLGKNTLRKCCTKKNLKKVLAQLANIHTFNFNKEKLHLLFGPQSGPNEKLKDYLKNLKESFKSISLLIFDNFDENIKRTINAKINEDVKSIKEFLRANNIKSWYNINSSLDLKADHVFFKNRRIYFIDFERFRPNGFLSFMQDLASLLNPPLFNCRGLTKRQLAELLVYYKKLLGQKQNIKINTNKFLKMYSIFQFYYYLFLYPTLPSLLRNRIYKNLLRYEFFKCLNIPKRKFDLLIDSKQS